MLRISLFLLIAMMSSAAVAHEGSMGAPDGSDCPDRSSAAPEGDSSSSTARETPAHGESKLSPDAHGELPDSRSKSARWHSFLPGMFR